MVNSVLYISISSPVLAGLLELYFVAPFADTVIVMLCGVKSFQTRVKAIDGIAAGFCSALCAGSCCPFSRIMAGNNSHRRMTARFIWKMLDSDCWWPQYDYGRGQWRDRPSSRGGLVGGDSA